MANNNIIKNKYYVIKKENEIYAYISVKKDFYTEGVLADGKTILQGYFYFYREFNAFLLNNDIEIKRYIEGISISPKEEKDGFDINGNIIHEDYWLYDASLDEFCDCGCSRKEKSSNMEFKLIEDEQLIKDINYLIRNGIRNLNDKYKFNYDIIKNHRYGNLKEVISDCRYENEKDNDPVFNLIIEDLKGYLNVLLAEKQSKELENEGNVKKKERKRNKNKKKK